MQGAGQQYQSLLSKENDFLERARRKEYEDLFDALARQGMVRADIHIEEALGLERKFMERFAEYALAEYKQLKDSASADASILREIYRNEINYFFGRSLQRVLGIVSNVRGSIPATYAQEFLEKVRLEVLRLLDYEC